MSIIVDASEATPSAASQTRDVLVPCSATASDGGDPSNTPPSNSLLYPGGEDWLELSLYLKHQNFDHLAKLLDEGRERAAVSPRRTAAIELQGITLWIVPNNAVVGEKSKRIPFRWVLATENGCHLLLMNRETPHETMPNGIFRACSMEMMKLGSEGVVAELHHALESLEIVLCRDKVTRVDVCLDCPDVETSEFLDPIAEGHYSTRARKRTDHTIEEQFDTHRFGREGTGISLGSKTKLRIYDKNRELMYQPEKLMLLAGRVHWKYSLTRVEFQLRRASLVRYGVDSLADWRAKRGAILVDLTSHWFRITDGPLKTNHAERTPTAALWDNVIESFKHLYGNPSVSLAPLTPRRVPEKFLLSGFIGLGVTILAANGIDVRNNEEFLHSLFYLMSEGIEDRSMADEVDRRRRERGGFVLPPDGEPEAG